MARPVSTRANLSISPLVFLLLVALIALVAWKMVIYAGLIPAGHPGGSAALAKQITTHVLVVVTIVALAGGAAAFAHYAFSRREGAGSIGAGLVLLLGVGVFAVQIVRYYAVGPTQSPAQAGTSAKQASPASQLAEQAQKQREAMEQAAARSREQLERLRSPQPVSPQPAAPGPAPRSGPTPVDAPRLAPSTPPIARPQTDPASEDKAKAALEPLRDEVARRSWEFLAEAGPMIDGLAKAPKALKSELEARVSGCSALKGKAGELREWFRGVDERASKALEDAGVDLSVRVQQRMGFSREVDGFAKANACGDLERLFDAGMEEAQTLQSNAGKWRIDPAGNPTSTDRSLQFDLKNKRESVQRGLRNAAEAKRLLTPKEKP